LIRERADARARPATDPSGVSELDFTTGDALFVFDDELTIRSWNAAAEALTGYAAGDVVGRRCWDVLGGSDETGALVCHAGCSHARLAREGWPVRCHDVVIRTETGGRRVALSTIALTGTDPRLFLHVMRPAPEATAEQQDSGDPVDLTPRQLQVLELIADGQPAKAIAGRLGIAVATVRNHIRAILLELGARSQLEAVAQARKRGLLGS
jgi:PAS domain S-box-containing protein